MIPFAAISAVVLAAGLAGSGHDPSVEEDVRAPEEKVVVEARRLETGPSCVPSPGVTRIGAKEIDSSGADTIQDLLVERPEVIAFDQVGNDLESDVDLRGFTGGTHAAVVLDGVRLNSPDDNRSDLELLMPEELEEVEVRRGADSTLYGAGAGAGVLRLRGRPVPEGTGGEGWAAAGSFATRRAGGRAWGGVGELRISAAAERAVSDGFRRNAGWGITRGRVRAEGPAGGGRLSFTFHHASLGADDPQSLKKSEWREDPEAAPFNGTDFHDARLDLTALRWDGRVGDWSVSGQLAARDQADDVLTTGRLGAGKRGFLTRTSTGVAHSVAQVSRGGDRWEMIGGIEASRARVSALGWETDSLGGDRFLVSDTTTDSRTAGAFLDGAMGLGRRWRLEGGVRLDDMRLETGGRALDPASRMLAPRRGARRFRVGSPRVALERTTRAGRWEGAWSAGISRGFLLPTSSQLFAYPGYGSNPGLSETGVLDLEAGWSGRSATGARLSVEGFLMEANDEVFFVLDDPSSPYGRNEGRDTRRWGLEVDAEVPVGGGWRLETAWTGIDATFRESWTAPAGDAVEPGDRVPLVSRHKIALRLEGPAGKGWWLRVHGRWVGRRTLDNDPAGSRPPLPSHMVWDAAAKWSPRPGSGWDLTLGARNILDRRYATRGIARVPDERAVPDDFFTPAPGRSLEAGVRMRF